MKRFKLPKAKIASRMAVAVAIIAVTAMAVLGSFFYVVKAFGDRAVAIYDGPLMATSFARSAYTNALLAEREIAKPKDIQDMDELETFIDDLLTDLEVVAERSSAELSQEVAGGLASQVEDLLDAVLDAVDQDSALPAAFASQLEAILRTLPKLIDEEAENGYLVREDVVAKQALFETRIAPFLALVLIVASAALVMTSTDVVRRLRRSQKDISALSDGNLNADIAYLSDRDEIGDMARAMAVLREAGLEKLRLEDLQAQRHAKEAEQARQAAARKATEDERQRVALLEKQAADEQAREEAESLVADLRTVLVGAQAGDFSQRMPARRDGLQRAEISELIDTTLGHFERAVTAIGNTVEAISDRNLSCPIEGDFEGAFRLLQTDMGVALGSISEALAEFRMTSRQVWDKSGNLAKTADDLFQESSSASNKLKQIKTVAEQIKTQAGGIAQLTVESKTIVEDAFSAAEDGERLISNAVKSVE